MNSESFDCWTGGVSVVKSKNLSISFGNKTSFESFKRAIRLILCVKNSFGTHNVCVGRSRNKIPNAIVTESNEFFIHSSEPCKVFGNIVKSSGLKCSEKSMKETRDMLT